MDFHTLTIQRWKILGFLAPVMALSVTWLDSSAQCQLRSSHHHPELEQPLALGIFLNSQAFPGSDFSWAGWRIPWKGMENVPFPGITILQCDQCKLSPSCAYLLGRLASCRAHLHQEHQNSHLEVQDKIGIFFTSFHRILEKKGKLFPDRIFLPKPRDYPPQLLHKLQ